MTTDLAIPSLLLGCWRSRSPAAMRVWPNRSSWAVVTNQRSWKAKSRSADNVGLRPRKNSPKQKGGAICVASGLSLRRGTQPHSRAASTTGARSGRAVAKRSAFQARPMMEAVAMSSSSRANDTLPDTAYGSSSGFSEYLSRMEWLILDRLTCPMVQPPKRRSAISS